MSTNSTPQGRILSPRERISKARINLLTDFPFFGSIAMHLIPIELNEEEVEKYGIKTIAVDEYGNLPYNPKFIEKLSDIEVKFVLCHEIMHVCLRHLQRCGTRKQTLWNVATDHAVNDILSHTFTLPNKCVHFPQLSGKSAEETYDWLIKNARTTTKCPQGFVQDKHIYGVSKKKGSSVTSGKKKCSSSSPFFRKGQQPIDVPRVVREAHNFARQQGNVPAGIERIFSDILNPVMNWKEVLRKFIVSVIPHDFTYAYPSKKSYSSGFYMPRVVREFIDIVVAVDSSGSITDEEYAEFLTEIYAMSKQFENLRMTVIVCDCEIQNVIEVTQTFDPYSIKGRGYGGTSSIPVYKWIKDNKNDNIKLLVYFTDGYIDIPREDKRFHTLWIITAEGREDEVKQMSNATVIKIPKRRH